MTTRFVPIPAEVAACIPPNGPTRSSSRYVLVGSLDPAGLLPRSADTVETALPGRVTSGGRFNDFRLLNRLRSQLPEKVRDALREDFEWYACRGAYFHTDAHYGDVLFGAWCVSGPLREIVFSRAGIRVPAQVGGWAIFDPFEPHAVLAQGDSSYRRDAYANTAPSHFVGFELALSESVRCAFGIEEAPVTAARLSSHIAVNAETGRFDAIGTPD